MSCGFASQGGGGFFQVRLAKIKSTLYLWIVPYDRAHAAFNELYLNLPEKQFLFLSPF
jgi:hypothetical protein